MQIIRHPYNTPNVGKAERIASAAVGSALLFYGLRKKGVMGGAMGFLSISLFRHAITGFCYTYQTLGFRTAERGQGRNISIPYELGIRVDEAITIDRPRDELYSFWRNLENLAGFLEHVESIRVTDQGKRSHWVVRGPGNRRVHWDAEVVSDIENEKIGWRSLDGSEVENAGSVAFRDAEGGRGTEIRVELQYNPPAGTLGALYARMFGKEPSQQIHADLQRLKMRLEAGVIPTTNGQPSGALEGEVSPQDKVGIASRESFPASDSPAYSH